MNRFGIREICDVVFKPLTSVDLGSQHFDAGQTMLYIDSAKTSSLEGAATTVYAQGGKGNPRLIAWDGEIKFTKSLLPSKKQLLNCGEVLRVQPTNFLW